MSSKSMIGLGFLMALGLAGVVYSASAAEPLGLLGSAGFVNLMLAAIGISERRALSGANAARSAVESATARTMGLIWLWGAAALVLVYTTVMSWREWTHFSAAFAAAGVISLGFSALLAKDAARGKEDETLLRLGRYFAIAQLVGMIATLIGLAVDPDKEILYAVDNDWAGNGIFVFGALALALVSAYALIDRKTKTP
jgi:hypothetical protein